jgi:hypothetical protein
MASFTTAGTLIKISAAKPATYNSTGFAALTFTTIGEITNLGEFSKVFQTVPHNPIATRQTINEKGSFDFTPLNLEMALDEDDAGQVLINAALGSDLAYSFEVTSKTGDKYYFTGKTMSFARSFGTVDQIITATATVQIDGEIVIVNAA